MANSRETKCIAKPKENLSNHQAQSIRSFKFNSFIKQIGRDQWVFGLQDFLTGTGYNKRQTIDVILERLDRVPINYRWIEVYPAANVLNMHIIRSGQAPILLDKCNNRTRGKSGLFRFEGKWLLNSTTLDILKNVWSCYIKGSYATSHKRLEENSSMKNDLDLQAATKQLELCKLQLTWDPFNNCLWMQNMISRKGSSTFV